MAEVLDHRFPCDNCGSDFRFDPDQGQLVCDHCGNTEPVQFPPTRITELDFKAAVQAQLPEAEIEETRVSQCPNCGAQVEFDADIHAKECAFCATPVVTSTGAHRHIKPKAVLPFALDEPAARAAMNGWLGSLWFAPNGLKEYARKGRKMNGIYVPYWTFDADTKTAYTGERGTHYYETRTVMRDGKRMQQRVRKTRWRGVRGRVARWFDDVLVLASKSLPKRFTDALEPWTLGNLHPYTPEFLAGFRAEGYGVQLVEGYDEARAKIHQVILRDIRFDIGGDAQRIHQVDTNVSDITFKHILLPVWLAAYKYRGKSYRFVVNGDTGRVQGERPYSIWKILIAIIIALILMAGAAYVGMTLEQQGRI
ncbi:MAG: TFIIB-type zinc finger domain-containing protein [Pseudomonadota bacterium]